MDQVIKYLHKSKANDSLLLSAYLSRVMVEIRSNTLNIRKIKMYLDEIYILLRNVKEDQSLYWKDYYLAKAFLQVFMNEDLSKVEQSIHLACQYSMNRFENDLAYINELLVVIANIYYECQVYEACEHYLLQAIDLCDKHENIDVYRRKKAELINILNKF